MDSRVIYEETISSMTEMLKETICNFKPAYNSAYGCYHAQPLFYIASPKLNLLKEISHFSNYQARDMLAKLGKKLCILFGHRVAERDCKADVDFYDLSDEGKRGYCFSMIEEYMPDLDEAVAHGMSSHTVVVLKDSCLCSPPNNDKYHAYPHKGIANIITLKEFFDGIRPGEFEIFQEYIGRLNYDAEIMLGLTVSPIPTKRELQKSGIRSNMNLIAYSIRKFLRKRLNKMKSINLKHIFIEMVFSVYHQHHLLTASLVLSGIMT